MAKLKNTNQLSFALSAKKPHKIKLKEAAAKDAKPVSKNVSADSRRYFYTPKSAYDPKSPRPYSLSRSKIDMFLKCPRCFYLEQRLGIKIPQGPAFSLNSAVDHLLKKEFDIRRAGGSAHPLMEAYGIDAIPAAHKNLEDWRNTFKGIRRYHKKTNLEFFGAIDDLWLNSKQEYHIVEYKATSTSRQITLNDQWKQWYKKQAEFYQWLFRGNDFKVSSTAYFVFCNAARDRKAFDGS